MAVEKSRKVTRRRAFDKGKPPSFSLLVIAARESCVCHPESGGCRTRDLTTKRHAIVKGGNVQPLDCVGYPWLLGNRSAIAGSLAVCAARDGSRFQRSAPLITTVISPFAGCAS